MHNQIPLMGNITKIEQQSDAKSVVTLTIKRNCIESTFDNIPIIVYGKLAKVISSYCKEGNYIGVKCHLIMKDDDSTMLIADKVTLVQNQQLTNMS